MKVRRKLLAEDKFTKRVPQRPTNATLSSERKLLAESEFAEVFVGEFALEGEDVEVDRPFDELGNIDRIHHLVPLADRVERHEERL